MPADFQTFDLGGILRTAAALKQAQSQTQTDALRNQVLGIQAQQAQTGLTQQQGVDSFLQANPNASLADLSKFGLTGVDAATKLIQARGAATVEQNRQLYTAGNAVANAPQGQAKATALQSDPTFSQKYDSVHGAGAWDAASDDVIRQGGKQVADHAILGLVDPDKQFTAQQQMIQDHYKQQGPGGDADRNAATIAAENARNAVTTATTQRGQDMTAATAASEQAIQRQTKGVPEGYERDPNNLGTLRPIIGGPHDPNATAAGMDSRSSAMFNRVAASANEAVSSLKNIAELPVTSSTGWFGGAQPGTTLMGSVKSVLGQKVTSQEAQDYKTMIAGVSRSLSTIETAGLAPNGSITHSMDSVTLNEGDSQLTKLRKLAETRQIIEKGIEPNLSNPKLAPAQRDLINRIIGDVQGAIPFTQHDITQLQQSNNPNATLMDFAKQSGLPTTQAQPGAGAPPAANAAGRPDLAPLQAAPGSPGTDPSQWDKRADGSQKGNGWLGLLRRPDGNVSSEISVGVNIGGKETEIPLMVPGLTRPEVTTLLNADPKSPNFYSGLPSSIKQKAVAFARQRISQGQSPFASPQESPGATASAPAPAVPPNIAALLDKYK